MRYDHGELLLAAMEARGRRCWACHAFDGGRNCMELSASIIDAHHLVPKQTLCREFPNGVVFATENGMGSARWMQYDPRMAFVFPTGDQSGWREQLRSLDELLMDVRNVVPLGRWHHAQIEARQLVVPRGLLPADTEQFAVELGLGWWLDRTYGERASDA